MRRTKIVCTLGPATERAEQIWAEINGPNLEHNIFPTRGRATLVLRKGPERRRRAWLDAGPQAPGKAGAFAAEAVTLSGPMGLVDDAGRMASELVASAIRHTGAPVELTVDTDPNMVRIEVRDDDPSVPGTGQVASFELREASTAR